MLAIGVLRSLKAGKEKAKSKGWTVSTQAKHFSIRVRIVCAVDYMCMYI